MDLRGTRFGNLEFTEQEVLELPEGLVGLPKLKRFLILDLAEQAPFRWLQSLDEPAVGFLIAEPGLFDPTYSLALDDHDLRGLAVRSATELTVFVLCTRRGAWSATTGNLLGPVVVHTETRRGRQLIVEDAGYSTHAPLHQVAKEAAGGRQFAAHAGAEPILRESGV
ncbi:hypothetical protein FJ251_12795 [bacterium]|nr:hypothetical protein [bacterium]